MNFLYARFLQHTQNAIDINPIEKGNTNNAARITSRENHAVWITGINLNDPQNPKIVINNSAASLSRLSYPLDTFLAAWEDSEFMYTAIGNTELPGTSTISGSELHREHIYLERIIRKNLNIVLPTGIQTAPFFDFVDRQDELETLGIKDRYNRYVRHVALEQKRIFDSYGLDPNTIKNVLDILVHE